MATVTTSALDGLLFLRNGSQSARWNFPLAVGSSTDAPAGLGEAVSLSFGFAAGIPDYAISEAGSGFTAFDADQQAATRLVLSYFSEVVRVTFAEGGGPGNHLSLGMTPQAATQGGYAYLPGFGFSFLQGGAQSTITAVNENLESGDVWLNSDADWTAESWLRGGDGWATLLHEIGHALGLKHPFEAPADGFLLSPELDNERFTVMSYNMAANAKTVAVTGSETSFAWVIDSVRPSSLMPLDLQALQHLYGSRTTTRPGNDTYTWAVSPEILETVWDGGGKDLLDCSNQVFPCAIDLREGQFSSIAIRRTLADKRAGLDIPAFFPDAEMPSDVYDGRDNLAIARGTVIENATGGVGADTITGNAGANLLSGLAGNDRLLGGAGNDTLRGAGGRDSLVGGPGQDELDGGAGNDTLAGGTGNDVFLVNDPGDVVTELAGEGIDLVASPLASLILPDQVEHGRLMAAGVVTGNTLSNVLFAGPGANRLDGGGGTEADTASYLFGLPATSTGGVVANLATGLVTGASGNDTLVAVEHLVGSPRADTLVGDTGDNRLDGGAGSDLVDYIGASAAVTASLFTGAVTGGAGNDTLVSVEHLAGSRLADVLTGGSGSNRLLGRAGNDSLAGGLGNDTLVGGTGADTLMGGAGNDIFDFDTATEAGLAPGACDVIADFGSGDRIDLSTIDANGPLVPGNGAFASALVGAFSSDAPGTLRFSEGVLFGNTDGDLEPEFAVILTGLASLSSGQVIP